ncbi:MAG: hypothetical protein NC400_02470 [Clostridium sp.]|nr:hypothetical protein [Clostridium sp.]
MKMKRFIALLAAGVMAFSVCIIASAAPSSDSSVSGNKVEKTESSTPAEWGTPEGQAAGAFAREVAATGVPYTAWCAAAEEGKSIEEYFSNSVMEVAGLDEVTPVGQGGGVVLDGKTSNVNFAIQKPALGYVDLAKAQAAAVGGTVLNVVNPTTTAVFETATVNFYMPGVTAEQNIQVYQYIDKQWVSLNVAEVRADHVVVDMTSLGTLAFVAVQ